MTSDTSEQEHKSNGADPLSRLSRMLRSMSRRWPQTSLVSTSDAFGVRLQDGRFLLIQRSGNWTAQDMRDWLALFAIWLVADADRLLKPDENLAGVSAKVSARSKQ